MIFSAWTKRIDGNRPFLFENGDPFLSGRISSGEENTITPGRKIEPGLLPERAISSLCIEFMLIYSKLSV